MASMQNIMPLDTMNNNMGNLPNAIDALQALVRKPTRVNPRQDKSEVPRSNPIDIPNRRQSNAVADVKPRESKSKDDISKSLERKKSQKEDKESKEDIKAKSKEEIKSKSKESSRDDIAKAERRKSSVKEDKVEVSKTDVPKRVSVSNGTAIPAPLMELPMLSRLNIDHMLSPPKETTGRQSLPDQDTLSKYKPQNYSISRENDNIKYSLKDFLLVRDIGSGGCAKVYQVKRMDDGKVFALKTMRQDVLIQREQVNLIDLGRTCQE